MKLLVCLIAFAACGYAAFLYHSGKPVLSWERGSGKAAEPDFDASATSATVAEESQSSRRIAADRPASPPASSPAATSRAASELDILYLVRSHSITTSSGLIGKKPGTKVKLVESTGRKSRVTDGLDTFVVDAAALTADPDFAVELQRKLQQADAMRLQTLQVSATREQTLLRDQRMAQGQSIGQQEKTGLEKESLLRQIAAAQSKAQQLRSRAAHADRQQSEALRYGRRASHNAGANALRDEADALEQRVAQWQASL